MGSMKVMSLVRHALCAGFILAAIAGQSFAPPPATPEVDPNTLGSAMALLAGGFCLLAGRRSKR